MSDSGWIQLHRQIRENWIWEDPAKLKAWLDILMMVNHEEKKILVNGELVTIHRGEKLTSIVKLSERWGWTRRRVVRFLDLLENDKMCTTNRTANGTTIKVNNYKEYQGFKPTKRTTNDTTNSTADDTPDDTADSTADDTQTIMNNNSSNNVNNFFCAGALKKIPPAKSDVEEYCRVKNYHMDVDGFMTYYNMNGWTLSGGRKIQDWQAAVDYWHTNGKKLGTAETKPAPYFDEFENTPIVAGVESPFKNGAAAEMLRRKREKNVRQR